MFSQACVKNFVHGGMCVVGACVANEHMHGKGRLHGKEKGACVVKGRGMCGRGHEWQKVMKAGGYVARVHAWQGDGYCSGRYASYWNAFLCLMT